jgi:hypothetical protein
VLIVGSDSVPWPWVHGACMAGIGCRQAGLGCCNRWRITKLEHWQTLLREHNNLWPRLMKFVQLLVYLDHQLVEV